MTRLDPLQYMAQRLCTKSDSQGNPRRLWLIISFTGNITQAIDEGYKGIPEKTRGLIQLPSLLIQLSEYNSLLKNFSEWQDRG